MRTTDDDRADTVGGITEETGTGGRDAVDGGTGTEMPNGQGGTDRLTGGADTVDGGTGTEMPNGQGEADRLTGGADTVDGGTGNETLRGQEGADLLTGGAGIDWIAGGGGADTAFGGEGDDIILGEAGNDSLAGGAGIDALFGGAGSDTLDGGANPATAGDLLFGGAGSDLYLVDSSFDLVDEGNLPAFSSYGFGGNDTIISKANFFWDVYSIGEVLQVAPDAADPGGVGVTLVGSVFSNLMIGSAGTDILFGRGGADTYRAGDGVDWISLSTLGVGDAPGYLANGVNTVIIEPRQTGSLSSDVVFEFEPGYDKVDLSAYGMPNFDALMARGQDDGLGSCYFALGDGLDYLYLVNIGLSQIRADDFIL